MYLLKSPETLNTSKGVITCGSLLNLTIEEIPQELSGQGAKDVRRINIRRDELVPTKHFILTFNTPRLPEYIRAGYVRCSVRPYISNPLRCFKCQRFGHSKTNCRGTLTCVVRLATRPLIARPLKNVLIVRVTTHLSHVPALNGNSRKRLSLRSLKITSPSLKLDDWLKHEYHPMKTSPNNAHSPGNAHHKNNKIIDTNKTSSAKEVHSASDASDGNSSGTDSDLTVTSAPE
ncbi:hypothetical protein AVEN_185530-1, partial [Araneus ventricosus]